MSSGVWISNTCSPIPSAGAALRTASRGTRTRGRVPEYNDARKAGNYGLE